MTRTLHRFKVTLLGLLLLSIVGEGKAIERRQSCPRFKEQSQNPLERPRPLVSQFNLVRAVARSLKERGYNGPTDGTFPDDLSKSVADVQRESNLPVTGDLDCETVKVILKVDLNDRSS